VKRALFVVAVLLVGLPASATVRSLQPSDPPFWPAPVLSPERLAAETVRVDSRGGGNFDTGTGVGVGAHVALTNAHLVNDRVTLVTRCDVDTLTSGLVERADAGLDLAVVVTNGADLIPIELADADPVAGQAVTIAGYPAGVRTIADARIEGTIARGSGTVLRFSPEPHAGQSGSPLVDAGGRLVGIAYADDTAGGQGLAIPVSRVRAALEQWRAAGVPIASPTEGDTTAALARTGVC
jgi:S1-C subfamily serine protease